MHGPSDAKTKKEKEQERTLWKVGKMSRRERDNLGVSYVHREIKEIKGRRSASQKIRSVYVRMVSSSPSK